MEKKPKSIAGKLRGLMPDCKDATALIIKEQEVPLAFGEKVRMYFHVFVICKFCRLFHKQSWALHHHIRHMVQPDDATRDYKLSDAQKTELQKVLDRAQGKS
jgi:hypothetical protein